MMGTRNLSGKNISQQIEWTLVQITRNLNNQNLRRNFRILVMEEKRRFIKELRNV